MNCRVMKLNIKHIVILLLAAVTLMACDRSGLTTTGQPILLAPTEAGETRAMLDSISFKAVGNQIRVYDYYTPTSGNPEYYINDIAQSNGNSWPFLEKHEWTPDGVHKFFGWLAKDVAMGETMPINPSFDPSNHVLTIPEITMSQTDTPQYDFMYSEISERNLNVAPNYTPVPMSFKHLFTAFRVTAANNSSNTVFLKKVSFSGLKKTRRANISYAGAKASVSFVDPANSQGSSQTKTPDFVYEIDQSRYDSQGKGLKLTQNAEYVSPGEDFTLMWPHASTDFDDAEILVEYNYIEKDGTKLHEDGSTTIKLKDTKAWEAGSKNVVGLMFSDKLITLDSLRVLPWNKTTDNIEFTNQISVSKPITWTEGFSDIDEENGEVYLVSDTSVYATCEFQIDTPSGATWTASIIPIEGSTDAFVIDEGYKYGNVGVNSTIRIRVAYSKPIQNRNIAKLRITVQTADERTIIANIMPAATNPEVTEYRIIQNLING